MVATAVLKTLNMKLLVPYHSPQLVHVDGAAGGGHRYRDIAHQFIRHTHVALALDDQVELLREVHAEPRGRICAYRCVSVVSVKITQRYSNKVDRGHNVGELSKKKR